MDLRSRRIREDERLQLGVSTPSIFSPVCRSIQINLTIVLPHDRVAATVRRQPRKRMLSGMFRIPSKRLLGIHSIGPSEVKVSIRVRSSEKANRISMRARLAPRQT